MSRMSQEVTLAGLAQRHNLFYLDNLGGGSLVDLTKQGLPECPTLQQGIKNGADLCWPAGTRSLAGRKRDNCRKKGLRAAQFQSMYLPELVRPAKLTLAALEARWPSMSPAVPGTKSRLCDCCAAPRTSSPNELLRLEKPIRRRNGGNSRSGRDRVRRSSSAGYCIPYLDHPNQTSATTEDQLYDVLLARGVVARRAQGRLILDLPERASGARFAPAARRCRFWGAYCLTRPISSPLVNSKLVLSNWLRKLITR